MGQVAFLPKPSQYLPAGQSTQVTPERILPASQKTPEVTLPAAQYLPASQAWHPLILQSWFCQRLYAAASYRQPIDTYFVMPVLELNVPTGHLLGVPVVLSQ
jgi:hypothetical protein